MLIEFSVANYRSFKEQVTFSMVAANLVAKDKKLDENNVFEIDKELKLLKSAAIYGANASGKSNLATALGFMRWFMINSSKETQSTEKIGVERFKLSTETEAKPSFFEIIFLMSGKRYRYGFEATIEKVVSEWLFYVPKSKETKLFERKLGKISVSKTYKADGIQQKTRHNALFLSVSAQFNVQIAEKILDWLTNKVALISTLNDRGYRGYTVSCLMDNENKDEILQLLKKLDLGFSDLKVEESEITANSLPKELPDELKNLILKNGEGKLSSVQTTHQKFDGKGNLVSTEVFDLDEQESEGTKKVFSLAGPLVDTLKKGKILIIDQFDARIHPLISRAIVELFNSNEKNPNNAQLIFMTHDTNLLNNKLFRRDQIWFTEKNRYGATDLYSLAEYKIPDDASFESDYIQGRYGAIPYIGNLNHLIDSHA
ncbi:AAA family ATPase [Nostoc sp. 'Lobaria pulmonaria (5183) cyanobiont']|uniref:AAA family ATPase n=1 Tax=Nostoc sp. 'Lobaria pulmonaria (5183) cyanobiont' TaxID=1618022 RepID=UPI000D0C19CB|nr:ATP-binding protein [Nostoc sp. 'Lobaria pulmonaria (5183) cyanobiont']AVH70954.1 abortive phage infection protein RloA [Nostoc sp. 'Lobaria pulmonaria (5183) cyanobiont']